MEVLADPLTSRLTSTSTEPALPVSVVVGTALIAPEKGITDIHLVDEINHKVT
jgi:hypothetical protein